jgi:AcrR family transcriptional regulator
MPEADPGRRRDGRTTDTRSRIEDVALELFIRKGFSGTTLQDIADELQLTKTALYYHYPSKDELIRSLVQPAIAAIDDFFAASIDAGTDARRFLEGFFDLNYHHRRIFLALIADPTGLGSVEAMGWVSRLAVQAQVQLVGPKPTSDQRIRAIMAVNGLSRCATLLTDIPLGELRERSVTAALDLLEGSR